MESLEYAEAPSTPGLVQEPNLSCVQEAQASDDHLESEDHNSNELVATVSTMNPLSKLDLHHAYGNAMDWSLQDSSTCDIVQCMPPQVNGNHIGGLEVKHAEPLRDSVNLMPMVLEYSEQTIGALDGSDRMENMQNASVGGNVPNMISVQQGVRSDETAVSPCCFHVTSDAQEPSHRTCPDSTNDVSEGDLMDGQGSIRTKIQSDAEISENVPMSAAPAIVDAEGHASREPKDTTAANKPGDLEEMSSNVLKPCSSHLSQPDMSSPGYGHYVEIQSSETSRRAPVEVQGL